MKTKNTEASTMPGADLEKFAKNEEVGCKYTTSRDAIQHLKELYLERSRIKYPSIPEVARTTPPFEAKSTNGLTKCITHFLILKGHQVERVSNQGRIIDNRKTVHDVIGRVRVIGSIQRIKSSGKAGTADLHCTIMGRSVKIEVKNENTKDRQRPEQKLYQKQVEAAGGIYVIITSFGQFLNWYYSHWDKCIQHGTR